LPILQQASRDSGSKGNILAAVGRGLIELKRLDDAEQVLAEVKKVDDSEE